MANHTTLPQGNDATVPAETSATERHAAALKALRERHKEAKQQLKQQLALELAEEQAEARRKEDRRNYLLGQALRRDRSEAAIALASVYAERLTHPSDRKLFGLSPLPEDEAKGADSPSESPEKSSEDEGDQDVEDALSRAATNGLPALSDVGEEKERSEEIALLDLMVVVSAGHPARHERGAENAAGEASDDMSHGAEDDCSDATMIDADERDDVASAGLGLENRHADSDRNGKEAHSPSSMTPPEDIDPWDEGTKGQTTDLTNVEQVSIPASIAQPSFVPQVFLSQATLKAEIDQSGAKRTKSADGRWIATAVTPEQVASLAALKLQPYEPK